MDIEQVQQLQTKQTQRTDRHLKLIYGEELYEKIIKSKVLIGGAGGVGCEIIKNLSKSGFRNFTVIDLDTIELTNLNRQFYFRKRHIGFGKSICAKEGVLQIEPEILNIEALVGNIFDPIFNDKFYRKFDLAFCAFDNQGARRHIGKKCIINNIPLLEAGTSGYSGNAQTRLKGIYECRNCKPETKQVVFNVCSIRSKPTEPIHCIVWAKNIYNLIFGPQEKESQIENYVKDLFPEGFQKVQNTEEKAIQLFNKIFCDDIKTEDNLEKRFPIRYEEKEQINNNILDIKQEENLIEDEKIFPLQYYCEKFMDSFKKLCERKQIIEFDKDDLLALKFVSSITNIRTYNFRNVQNPKNKLQYLSEHKIKQMAGNIIDAIASSNAIVAAIQVNEAIKVMQGKHLTNPEIFKDYLVENIDEKILVTDQYGPNINCSVCSNSNFYINLEVNIEQIEFLQLLNYFQKVFLANVQIVKLNDQIIYYDQMKDQYKQLFCKKIKDLPFFNKEESIFRCFNLEGNLLWEFHIEINNQLNGILAKTSPEQIKNQYIKYFKEIQKYNLQKKINLFAKFKYI